MPGQLESWSSICVKTDFFLDPFTRRLESDQLVVPRQEKLSYSRWGGSGGGFPLHGQIL